MKKILVLALFSIILINLFAIEGGGLVSSDNLFVVPIPQEEKPFRVSSFNKLSLWLKQNMDKEGNYNFALQGSYWFTLDSKIFKNDNEKKTVNEIKHIIDLDYLNFSFLFPLGAGEAINFNFGRYGVMDYTGLLYKQTIDGLTLEYKHPKIKTSFDFGYTGALNTYTTPLYVTPKETKNPVYSLAPAFITLGWKNDLPVGPYDHKLGVDMLAFVQPKKEDPSHKIYVNFHTNGSIVPRLLYDLSLVYGFVREANTQRHGALINFDLGYYFNKLNSVFGTKTVFATGGKNTFSGFTKQSLAKNHPVYPQNVLFFSVYTKLEPVKNLQLGADLGVVSKAKKAFPEEKLYKGFDWQVHLNYLILDEIYLGCNVGQYIRNTGKSNFNAGLKLVISF